MDKYKLQLTRDIIRDVLTAITYVAIVFIAAYFDNYWLLLLIIFL